VSGKRDPSARHTRTKRHPLPFAPSGTVLRQTSTRSGRAFQVRQDGRRVNLRLTGEVPPPAGQPRGTLRKRNECPTRRRALPPKTNPETDPPPSTPRALVSDGARHPGYQDQRRTHHRAIYFSPNPATLTSGRVADRQTASAQGRAGTFSLVRGPRFPRPHTDTKAKCPRRVDYGCTPVKRHS
jgi:hypothetical protein